LKHNRAGGELLSLCGHRGGALQRQRAKQRIVVLDNPGQRARQRPMLMESFVVLGDQQ
jgi:hypothetical protein